VNKDQGPRTKDQGPGTKDQELTNGYIAFGV
jgi:hypothetical protein